MCVWVSVCECVQAWECVCEREGEGVGVGVCVREGNVCVFVFEII